MRGIDTSLRWRIIDPNPFQTPTSSSQIGPNRDFGGGSTLHNNTPPRYRPNVGMNNHNIETTSGLGVNNALSKAKMNMAYRHFER
jgi:hypothetical protein